MDEAELVLHYQPKVDLRTGQAKGVEALARWHHPERGMLPPDEFIPLAERSSLLRPVTLYLLDDGAAPVQRVAREGHRHDGGGEPVDAEPARPAASRTTSPACSTSWRLPAGSLELEITESTIMADRRRAQTILTRLSKMGVRLSIDDFGTGYSSLAYLQELPVDAIKIDKSFVHDDAARTRATPRSCSRPSTSATTSASRSSPRAWRTMTVYNALARLGCDYAQGYFLSKPLPPEKFSVWMQVFASPVEDEADGGERRDPPSDEDAQLQEWIVA